MKVEDCTCPVCNGDNVRGFKVHDAYHGWWSECLDCKAKYGNGWFAFSEVDHCFVLDEKFGRGFAAEGGQVDFIGE